MLMTINYWRCLHSMLSRVYETIKSPSVSLSHHLTADAACASLLLSPMQAGNINRQWQHRAAAATQHGAQQQMRQCHHDSWRMKLNTHLSYLFYLLTCLLVPSVLWRCWLGGRKSIWPVKNWAVGCWHSYLSGARCRLAYGPADATATHCLLFQWNPDWFYLPDTSSPG